jgi:hypothetical protein
MALCALRIVLAEYRAAAKTVPPEVLEAIEALTS